MRGCVLSIIYDVDGARVAKVLVSRADNLHTKLNSIVLGLLLQKAWE